MIILVPVEESNGIRRYEFDKDNVFLGREEGDILLNDNTVSRLHAKIYSIKGQYYIEDLKSTNGTYLNYKRINNNQLNYGDVLTLGKISFFFYTDSDSSKITKQEALTRVLDKYRLLKEIGRGGMSKVYIADDISNGYNVAIKIPTLDGRLDNVVLDKFYNEIRIGFNLQNSENVVNILDSGEIDGLPYIVMEYLEGVTLREILIKMQVPLSINYIVDVMSQALKGLINIHNKGIIHCDFKAENIMVSDTQGVNIFDFGVSEFADESWRHHGTPYIMSPEQCNEGPIDLRSDIYSAGIVLYELATSKIPYEFGSDSQLMYSHKYVEPVKPSSSYNGINRKLEYIILKCLSKEPVHRYQEVNELMYDLNQINLNNNKLSYMLEKSLAQKKTNRKEHLTKTEKVISSERLDAITEVLIEVFEGPCTGESYIMKCGYQYIIGRGTEANIIIPDEFLSRQHAAITVTENEVYIDDLGSSNGTSVGGSIISETTILHDGAVVKFGNTALTVNFK